MTRAQRGKGTRAERRTPGWPPTGSSTALRPKHVSRRGRARTCSSPEAGERPRADVGHARFPFHEQAAMSAACPGRSSTAAPRLWPTEAEVTARWPLGRQCRSTGRRRECRRHRGRCVGRSGCRRGALALLRVVRCGRQLETDEHFCSGPIVSSDLASTRTSAGAQLAKSRGEFGPRRAPASRRRVSAHGDDEPVAGSAVELGRQQREEDREGLSVEAEPVAAVGFTRNDWRTR